MALTLPPVTASARYDVCAPVVAHNCIVGNEFEIFFHAPQIAASARPGQFMELQVGDPRNPLERRPFSICRVDPASGTVSVLYLARGSFTSELARKEAGDTVWLIGPLGRPFTWSVDPEARHLLIAGGIGAPPLTFLARALCAGGAGPERVIVLNGARTQELLVGMVEFGELPVSLYPVTDDGSHGARGLAPEHLPGLLDALPPGAPPALYACGPMAMLRAIGAVAIRRALACELSIETPMPCGVGTCGECAVAVRDPEAEGAQRAALACMEGPVFEARDLLWPGASGD